MGTYLSRSSLSVGKDCALVSFEYISNDGLECLIEHFFLRRKACKHIVKYKLWAHLFCTNAIDDYADEDECTV